MKWNKLALAGLLGIALNAQAMQAEDVKSFQLANGMKFLVLESHTIPNANMYTYWKVGSRNEVPSHG